MSEKPASQQGLTTQEAEKQRARGLGNNIKIQTSRSYLEIIQENVFTFINNVLFGLGIALVLVGRTSDALVSVVIILINVVVSVIQEIRAKRTLDSIALLARPTANIVRDGRELVTDPAQIVVGDVLIVRPGDQVLVDGVVLSGQMDADESLLTGESDLVRKVSGTTVYSGSFSVTGTVYFEAQKVGKESLANQLTTGARAFRRVLTPIQQEINLVIRILLLVAVYFEFLLIVNAIINKISFVENIKMSVVIAGLVPNGLFVAIALAYALGAVRIAGKGALVQQANAVESLSNVDILCLDKTGTLTANQIQFNALHPFGVSEAELRLILGDFAASGTAGNRTSEAIAAACPGKAIKPVAEVTFSSERKWSGLVFDTPGRRGTYVLGALEMLEPALAPGSDLGDQAGLWSDQGLRVVLFAWLSQPVPLGSAEKPALPTGLVPLGLVALSDVLRPEASQTLTAFAKAGVQLKIISGDNPQTVVALARQAGLGPELASISGLDLARLSDGEFSQAAEHNTVFGRISPQQKEQLIHVLRQGGHYVAMIGDGVNDVLSLKQSNLGIAMQSGSQATRSVADIILIGDTFASLPFAVQEGQRIINGMHSILKIFLSRTIFAALAILSTFIIGSFPFSPKQSSIFALLAVGIPSMALAAWAMPGKPDGEKLIRQLLHFVLPASLTMSIFGLIVFAGFFFQSYAQFFIANPQLREHELILLAQPAAQTALTSFSILCALLLIVFTVPPTRFFAAGNPISKDWRPTFLALGLLAVYFVFLLVPSLSAGFDFLPLTLLDHLLIFLAVAAWTMALRWTWRWRLVDRFLSTDLQGDPGR
jgi:cation-transporting ATPase E